MVLLPEPDSPTRPSVSPGWMLKDTSSTARLVVDRAEMQQRTRTALVDLEAAAIPASTMETGVANATQFRLRRKRHIDTARPRDIVRRQAVLVLIVELELPLAVQRLPLIAHQLWPRIFELPHRLPRPLSLFDGPS